MQSKTELYLRATDPRQYDNRLTGWDGQGATPEAAARVEHYAYYLTPHALGWEGKDVLDVGAGNGWLVDLAQRLEAWKVVGIEPSANQIALSRSLYPNANLIQKSLEEYEPEREFDVVTSVLAFGHIKDPQVAFDKIARITRTPADVLLVVLDYDYAKDRRDGERTVLTLESNEEEFVQMIAKRDGPPLADIVRKPIVYIRHAENAGFTYLWETPMPPTEKYMGKIPRYQDYRGIPMTRLLHFSR